MFQSFDAFITIYHKFLMYETTASFNTKKTKHVEYIFIQTTYAFLIHMKCNITLYDNNVV